MTASAMVSMASGSSTVAMIGVLIPLVLVLLLACVPLYFRLSARRRRAQGEEHADQRDLAAEVEAMRRRQAGE